MDADKTFDDILFASFISFSLAFTLSALWAFYKNEKLLKS